MHPTIKSCRTCPNTDCLLQLCPASTIESDNERHRRQTHFPRGKVVFRQGEPVNGIYLIQSGLVKIEASGRQGAVILGIRKKGDPLGHHSLRSAEKHAHTAVSVSDASLCIIEPGHFRKIVDACHQLREKLYDKVASEAREFGERLLTMANLSVKARVADTLLYVCGLYDYRGDGSGMRIHLDREEMAMLAGTTKEQVSKVLGEFRRKGLVGFRAKYFKHLDIAGLKVLSGRVPDGFVDDRLNDGPGNGSDGNRGGDFRLPAVA